MRNRWYLLIPVVILFGLIAWRIVEKKLADAEQQASRAKRTQMPALVAVAPV